MARLLAFGGDSGTRELEALDSVDLEAIALARAWGYQNGHKERGWTFQRCERPCCNGALISAWGFDGCMLCGRSGASEPPARPRRRDEHQRKRARL